MPKRNVELLTQVRDLIKADPSKLDMSHWGVVKGIELDYRDEVKVNCGTTACIAGWAVQLVGDKFLVHGHSKSAEGGYSVSLSVAKNGRVCDIEKRARKILGLTYDEAAFLFMDTVDSQALSVLDQLIAGQDIIPEGYDDDDEY